MPYTVAVKAAAHTAVLDLITDGSTGTAGIVVLAGATTLVTLPIDHASSSVSGTTGQLTLVPDPAGATAVASGTATIAQLVARDGSLIDDGIPVAAGVSPVSGSVVLSSLSIISGGQIDLISCTIG